MSAGPVIFLLSNAFAAYVLAGYPLALSLWARLFPKPIRKNFVPQELTILIPVRNGERWIESKLQSLFSSTYPADLLKILIVSDGSTDSTAEIVRQFPDARVKLLQLPPGGKALAVNKGLAHVASELIVLTDVRQSFDKDALKELVSCFADPAVGVVTGELVIREGLTEEETNTGLYWKYEKWIRRNLNRVDAMLGATGSIYAIRREAVREIPAGILLDDVYLPFAAVARGYRIYFEERAKAYDLPTSLKSEFRRKVRTQAGVYQIVRYFPALLWPGNRRFVHFFSHKLGRLLLPFALVAAAVSTFGLAQPWRFWALAGQVVFYGAALADPLIREGSPIKRPTAVIRTFVVLVAAAAAAISIFFMPAQSLWKETQVNAAQAARSSLNAKKPADL